MANKRVLKRVINEIGEELFAEYVAATHYDESKHNENPELLMSILRTRDWYISRVSHPEPGMPAKVYYRDLVDRFQKQVNELVDQLNALG